MKQYWKWIRNQHISAEESDQLLQIFSHSAKIALELEYNLSGLPASCPGDSSSSSIGMLGLNAYKEPPILTSKSCPCTNKHRFSCKDRCIVESLCSKIPNRSKCKKDQNGTCDFQQYPTCPTDCSRWEFSCLSSTCTDFQAPCNFGCIYFNRECTTCPLYKKGKLVPHNVRTIAKELFKPSEAIEDFGKTGVERIDIDSSLLGDNGIEICTVGRRMNISGMWKLNNELVKYCLDRGAYVNNRCSIHMHLLLSHFPHIDIKDKKYIGFDTESAHKPYQASKEFTEAEGNIPTVVLGNFIQLIRRFTPALVWLSSTGDKKHSITRWAKYRQPFVHISPLENGVASFIDTCVQSFTFNKQKPQDKGKYGFINFNHVIFQSEDDNDSLDYIRRFHLESRFMDGNLSPTAITAFMVLHYALLMKAVRISRYGLLEAFSSKEEQTRVQELTESILNNNPEGWGDGNRDSECGTLFETGRDYLVREDCKILLSFLRNELSNSLGLDAVLWSLIDFPISLRRRAGESWENIEKSLWEKTYLGQSYSYGVDEIIDTVGTTIRAKTIDEWMRVLMEENEDAFGISKEELVEGLSSLVRSKKIIWHEPSGSFIRP